MPNWCNNDAVLQHMDRGMLEKARDGFNNGGMFGALIPCPQLLLDTMAGGYGGKDTESKYKQELLHFQEKLNLKYFGYKNWYDWCVAEWGTKWDIGRGHKDDPMVEIDDGDWPSLTLSFESAWSPPIGAYEKLEAMGFVITAKYFEPGVGFCGEWFEGMDHEYSLEDAPKHLDDLYGISDSLAQWEEDNR